MPNYQKAKDVFTQRKVVDGTFEEYPLVVQPNSVIITDADNNLVMTTTASLLAGTSSIESAISASHANIADLSLTTTSASHANIADIALTSSYLEDNSTITASAILVTGPAVVSTLSTGEGVGGVFMNTDGDATVYRLFTGFGNGAFIDELGNYSASADIQVIGITASKMEGTALSSARITAANSIIATTLHSQANTPGFDRIHLSIQNPTATTTISIAIAVTNSADTATAFAGSYMIAEKVR